MGELWLNLREEYRDIVIFSNIKNQTEPTRNSCGHDNPETEQYRVKIMKFQKGHNRITPWIFY